MSSASKPLKTEAVFTDTSVLYDYSKDAVKEAETLFEEYTALEKVTSEFGHEEFKKVAERRAEAYEAWEEAVSDGRETVGDYQFTEPDDLKTKDLDILREFQRELVQNCDQVEALRRINARGRQYEKGVEKLFGTVSGDPLVKVVSVSANENLLKRFKLDIQNHNDRQLLAEAVEWYNSAGTDIFVTSDKDDFQGETDGGTAKETSESAGLPATLEELGQTGTSLQEDLNEHIDQIYTNINHLTIKQLIDFVNAYQSP
ncbi:hypothetical protein [Natrinema altunense]|uniref:DUF4935 domain-containing protein n=1 Tax=Natrinema altunense TaxID=222984 RepID=A0A482Y368_9EURY|nr:hypothetical protein [Natrinema altunense]RZH67187.1 hypothetical protein ELS17_15685 [Natrinema altunense]